MLTDIFHPATRAWFAASFDAPTPPQLKAWPAIKSGKHALIAAPTGSGKTLAAFLCAIDDLAWQAQNGTLQRATQVVYISPLKALSNDIEKNLRAPLTGIREELIGRGIEAETLSAMVRTGDTPQSDRQKMLRKPPHILVTTPESLHILLTAVRGREMLSTVRTIIVDEIHALVPSKRGSHLSLTLERLQDLVAEPLVRIGLSATQKPIELVAKFLVGARPDADCTIVDAGHKRALDLQIEVPDSPLEAVMSGEVREEVFDRIAELIAAHRTTLVFMNTRKQTERFTKALSERLGDDMVTSHHGSLSKEHRLAAEQRLKSGELRALVATASLEMGIDIGAIDLVVQVASPRSIAGLLQRIGRSGHAVGALPKGRLFPLSRDDMVECVALLDAVRRGELDRIEMPEAPLDILAQQIVATAAGGPRDERELFAMVTRAWPYRDVSAATFEAVVQMLADGFSTRRGRRARWLHRDRVQGIVHGRRGARFAAITSGGAIPDNADFQVLLQPSGTFIGTLNEDFAIESMPGDIFQLGNSSWRIARVEPGKVLVQDAHGAPPTLPFWLGEAPARTVELSTAVARVRQDVVDRIEEDAQATRQDGVPLAAVAWLMDEVGVAQGAAEQTAAYIAAMHGAMGVVPTQTTLVLERFFDSSGGMQLVLHAPFGARVNRAWGLALRKRFCKSFNFELQAAATDNAILLSLGTTHSFPLEDVWRFLHSDTVRDVLVQALLDAPMFEVRWRWNAGRALAVLRFRGGRKVPPQLQRMQAQDLVAVVFPDQLACFENITGGREVPDHPLVNQTVDDCLREAMDIDRLEALLRSLQAGELNLVTRDVTEPSPFSLEVVNAMPYAFLDDAPLEERRTQAVMAQRWLSPAAVRDLQALDAGAIERVRDEVWPLADDREELHDALVVHGFLTEKEGLREGPELGADRSPARSRWFDELRDAGRATRVMPVGGQPLWVAAERLGQLRRALPHAVEQPPLAPPDTLLADDGLDPLVELLRNRLEMLGPATTTRIAEELGLAVDDLRVAMLALESEGFVFRGGFEPGEGEQWCDRRLLARIHRYTVDRLRREIEPVTPAAFMRFAVRWQGLVRDDTVTRPTADQVLAVARQLEGFEAAAVAWEGDLLPSRCNGYDPVMLDGLCLSGRIAWGRLTPGVGRGGPIRSTPIALFSRRDADAWFELAVRPAAGASLSSSAACVSELLRARGACFFAEIERSTPLLESQVEGALAELVAAGECASDGFVGLRALLTPSSRRPRRGSARHTALFGMEGAGRWSTLPVAQTDAGATSEASVEVFAHTLLRRYGVVCRSLLTRESLAPRWRLLLRVYRHMEARGELRGGRFIAGQTGEQFALPEAIKPLRKARHPADNGSEALLVSISGADPLNLVGVLLPGDRVAASAFNRLLLRDGEAVAVRDGGEARVLVDGDDAWRLEKALLRRAAPPQLKAYLGK